MSKPLLVLILISMAGVLQAQNIYSALHLNEELVYKTRRPKKIAKTIISYRSGGARTEKSFLTFDAAGMLYMEERFDDDDSLTARLTYTNDTVTRHILSRVFERWTRFGYNKETAWYSYDPSGYFIRATDKNANDRIIRTTDISCNDKGYPAELTVVDGMGHSNGKETADYMYEKNKVFTAVITNDGRVLSRDTMKISFIHASQFPGEGEVYNDKGDMTAWVSRNLDHSRTFYEAEYTYDQWGNCLEEKVYEVTVKKNGSKKRTLERVYKKAYPY